MGAKETTSLSSHIEPLPLTYRVEEQFAEVLRMWLEKRLGSEVILLQAFETTVVSNQATMFDLRYINTEGSETYALIEANFL